MHVIKLLFVLKVSYECNAGSLDVLLVSAAGLMLGADTKGLV